jgi:rhodanese-related sulfurtransferase
MLDFYAPDFADRLAQLDPDVPYLIYCRSGNRSGQTLALMEDLGFTDVADVDGGILAWGDAGLPVVP